ncbi:MAG: Fe-S cluster assembly protein SufD [Candidatus Nanopelagicales bacterium]
MTAVDTAAEVRDPDRFEIPSGREEAWRFTPLRRLAGLHDHAQSVGGTTYRVTTGAEWVRVVERDDPRLDIVAPPTDRVSAISRAAFQQAAVVEVPAGTAITDPIRLDVEAQAEPQAFGQVVLDIGADASAVVVITHTGSGAYAGDITVRVGDGAVATVAVVQRMADDAVLVGHVRSVLGRDARLRAVAVTLGGDLVRLSSDVSYTAPGGDAELIGAFLTRDGRHHEHRLFVDHSVPDCRSDVTYKGALAGAKAHSVWVGDVLIRAAATGTSTYETNRNLVLTEGARADSIPNLEIETGDVVGAGHAAATGRFDDEQLFYLQSRGIPAPEARRLVVRGFFADVVRRIGVPDVETALMDAVDEELADIAQERP